MTHFARICIWKKLEKPHAHDIIKKYYFHSHSLDKQQLIKELGDVCWYIAQCCSAIDTDMETVMEENIRKLAKRYPNGFNSMDSINRKD